MPEGFLQGLLNEIVRHKTLIFAFVIFDLIVICGLDFRRNYDVDEKQKECTAIGGMLQFNKTLVCVNLTVTAPREEVNTIWINMTAPSGDEI